MTEPLIVPADLLPADGRFGSGPSKVPAERLAALAATGTGLMGTSHRQAPVKALVRRVREGLTALFGLEEGYEVVLANGGAAAFWDVAVHSLILERSQHAVFGEFGRKFYQEAAAAPWLSPSLVEAPHGSVALPEHDADADAYCWTHNETSTGVMAPVLRPAGATADQLTIVDATSAAGGAAFDPAEADVYFFSPQKSFASDGGLWIAVLSPAAVERAEQVAASGRYIPAFFSLTDAIANSRADQTNNTPAVATLYLMAESIDWMLKAGGLEVMAARSAANTGAVYDWAEASEHARPFVADPALRSSVVATIEVDPRYPVKAIEDALRANGIVDVNAYRGVGANQLRFGLFPGVELADVRALTASIDYVIERM